MANIELLKKLIREKLSSFSDNELKDMLVECLCDKSAEEFDKFISVDNSKKVKVYLFDNRELLLVDENNRRYYLDAVWHPNKNKCLLTSWEDTFHNHTIQTPNCVFLKKGPIHTAEVDRKLIGYIDAVPQESFDECAAILRKFLPHVEMDI